MVTTSTLSTDRTFTNLRKESKPDTQTISMHPTPTSQDQFTVYYDGGCPLCTKEIETYRKFSGAEHLNWVDAANCDTTSLGDDLDSCTALERMHVRDETGKLISGAAAFAAIWRQFPKTRLFGQILGTQPVLWVLEPAYRLFLKIRPLWRKP